MLTRHQEAAKVNQLKQMNQLLALMKNNRSKHSKYQWNWQKNLNFMHEKHKDDKQKYATPMSFIRSGYAMNPRKVTKIDSEYAFRHLLDKDYNKANKHQLALNRLSFNPTKMRMYELKAYVKEHKIHSKRKGRKVTGTGKTNCKYTSDEINKWDMSIAANAQMFTPQNNDISRYQTDCIRMSDELKDEIEAHYKWQNIPIQNRDDPAYFHKVYEYIYGDYNFYAHFHRYIGPEYAQPADDIHMEPRSSDSDYDDLMKEHRKELASADSDLRKEAMQRYGVRQEAMKDASYDLIRSCKRRKLNNDSVMRRPSSNHNKQRYDVDMGSGSDDDDSDVDIQTMNEREKDNLLQQLMNKRRKRKR
eukprot:255934_1